MNRNWNPLLREYNDFSGGDGAVRYIRKEAPSEELEREYGLRRIAGKGDGFDRAVRLLDWLSTQVRHRSDYDNSDPPDALTLLRRYGGKPDRGINCLALSNVFTQCLLAVGIPARAVQLIPFSPEDGDSHAVAEIYSGERQKWILLDPTYNGFLRNAEGMPLHCLELREEYSRGRIPGVSSGLRYDSVPVTDLADLHAYYAKNLFFLRCKKKQAFGSHTNFGDFYEIAPDGFDPQRRMVENLRWRIREYGMDPLFSEWLAWEEIEANPCLSAEAFYRPPVLETEEK